MAAVMEAKEAQAPVTKPAQTMKLRHNRMERAEVQRTQWLVTCEPNTKPEDLLNPAYWAHVAIKFNPRDVLEVWAEDGEWYAECMVRATDRTWAKVHIKQLIKFEDEDVPALHQLLDYNVMWRGPHRKWSVMRLSDRSVVKEDCKTSDEAQSWLTAHRRTIGG